MLDAESEVQRTLSEPYSHGSPLQMVANNMVQSSANAPDTMFIQTISSELLTFLTALPQLEAGGQTASSDVTTGLHISKEDEELVTCLINSLEQTKLSTEMSPTKSTCSWSVPCDSYLICSQTSISEPTLSTSNNQYFCPVSGIQTVPAPGT